jgi:MYXO-CTERM domain-containing protein
VPLDETLTVAVQTSVSDEQGEYTGWLLLTGDEQIHRVPYHYRLLPVVDRDLLILDLSFLALEQLVLVDLYGDLADEAGIDYSVLRVTDASGAPALAKLQPFRAVLAFTGNDQVAHKRTAALQTLDVLSSYTRGGGRLILVGQGPLRGTSHERIGGMLGAATHSGFPLFDQYTIGLLELPDYQVFPVGSTPLIDRPVDIGPTTDGQGDLTLVGEVVAVLGSGLPEVWSEAFLRLDGASFPAGGNLGVLFDPYRGWGTYPEIEVLTHRSAVIGFGFERIGSATTTTAGRQELFEALYEWTTARIELTAVVESVGRHVVIHASTSGGLPATFEYDYGDGSAPVISDSNVDYYEYESFGPQEITVLVRSELGAVDIERLTVDLVPAPDAAPPEPAPDAGMSFGPAVDSRVRDCGCAAVGASGASSGGWLLLLAVASAALRRTHGRRRKTKGRGV